MAIDVQYLSDGKKHISINDSDYDLLEGAIQFLYEKTGLTIDQYKDARIYPDHLKILLTYVKQSENPGKPAHVIRFFEQAVEDKETLFFSGD